MAGNQRFAPLLLMLLIGGVSFALVRSFLASHHAPNAGMPAISIPAPQSAPFADGRQVVRGIVGSEKREYLTDPRVLDIFRRHGIELQIDTSGSRDMANRPDLSGYDFAFPAGIPAAQKLMKKYGVGRGYYPFYTPMVIASWVPIADVLGANSMVARRGDAYYTVDMRKLLGAIQAHRRWSQLSGNSVYEVDKGIIISSTDVRKSNSAAMYLSLASYILNGGEVVTDLAQARRIGNELAGLFLRQGYQESSSAGPFEDYTSMGMGKAPLVVAYEAQFIEYEIEHPDQRNTNMALLYPDPTVFTKHVLVPLSPLGDKAGTLLETDSDLRRLAVEHGLRTSDMSYAASFWRQHGVKVPETVIDVVNTPNYDILEAMIGSIEREFARQ
jgi:hypothetical protein